MKVNINYGRTPEMEAQSTNQSLTRDYIEFQVQSAYPNMEGKEKVRTYGRIQRKLDEAVEKNSEEIVLEEAEKDMIKDCFKNPKFPAQISKYAVKLLDVVDSLDEKKAEAPVETGDADETITPENRTRKVKNA